MKTKKGSADEAKKKQSKPAVIRPKRGRPPVTITLSEEARAMAHEVSKVEGATLSRLVERWIRSAFREWGLVLPTPASE